MIQFRRKISYIQIYHFNSSRIRNKKGFTKGKESTRNWETRNQKVSQWKRISGWKWVWRGRCSKNCWKTEPCPSQQSKTYCYKIKTFWDKQKARKKAQLLQNLGRTRRYLNKEGHLMSNDDYSSLILLFNLVWKENQAQMVQNRMMNLSSSQELPHLKPKAFRPSWLLPGKSIHFDLPSFILASLPRLIRCVTRRNS